MTALLVPFSQEHDLGCAETTLLRGSWYEIDLGAIRHNYRQLREQLPTNVKIYACLKRNGYGCGAGPVAGALASEGADGFAVASLLDAVSIRRAGVGHRILLYPGALPTAGPMVEALDLTVSVSSIDELERWRSVMTRTRVFIKVDLGFFRAGATPQEAGGLLAAAHAHSDVHIDGIYAHLSELPTSKPTDAVNQLGRMQAILAGAEARGGRPVIAMMSSTEGVLTYPDMDLDAVDPGALFVGLPEAQRPTRHLTLRPALKAICTTVVAMKRLDVSLGPTPEIPGFQPGMVLGVLGMGWGDGLPRLIPRNAEAIVGGKRARLLPPAHLEHLRIDLTEVPEARFGDQVVLLGRQGDEVITHEEIAALWGTDVIGLYAGLRDHIPRIYT
ncbi:alanine racemase [Ensifer adhaerens]